MRPNSLSSTIDTGQGDHVQVSHLLCLRSWIWHEEHFTLLKQFPPCWFLFFFSLISSLHLILFHFISSSIFPQFHMYLGAVYFMQLVVLLLRTHSLPVHAQNESWRHFIADTVQYNAPFCISSLCSQEGFKGCYIHGRHTVFEIPMPLTKLIFEGFCY